MEGRYKEHAAFRVGAVEHEAKHAQLPAEVIPRYLAVLNNDPVGGHVLRKPVDRARAGHGCKRAVDQGKDGYRPWSAYPRAGLRWATLSKYKALIVAPKVRIVGNSLPKHGADKLPHICPDALLTP